MKAFDERVVAWTASGRRRNSAPVDRTPGCLRRIDAKWATDARPDVSKLVELAFAVGQWPLPASVWVSACMTAIAILRRFGKSDYLRDYLRSRLRGAAVLCIRPRRNQRTDLQIVETDTVP